MLRRLTLAAAGGVFAVVLGGGAVLAAEPFAECGSTGAELNPAGFDSPGFAGAELVYAGSENSHSNPNNWHAVSQYDIACVHYTAVH
jgi:hypothetical protein